MEYQGQKYKSIKSTCRGCPHRVPGCHDHCEDYLEAQEDWIEFRRKAKTNKRLFKQYDEYRINAFDRKR